MDALIHLCLLVCFMTVCITECLPLNITTSGRSYQPLSPHGIHIRGLNWITFQVKARRDAYIGLQTYYNNTNATYEVVLGFYFNQKSAIKKHSSDQEVANESPLSFDEYSDIWVSWTGGTIAVGQGSNRGSGAFMSWTDPSPVDINYVVIMTISVEGNWIFETTVRKETLKFGLPEKDAIYTPSNARIVTAMYVTLSPLACGASCLSKPWCRAFSYGTSDHQCNMFDVAPKTGDLVKSEGWETWSMVQ